MSKPKIRKIRQIKSEIKEIEKIERDSSDLEEDVEQTSAEREVSNFINFLQNSSSIEEISTTIHANGSPQVLPAPRIAQRQQSQQDRWESVAARPPYETAGRENAYASTTMGGTRIRRRNVYNPTIRPTMSPQSGVSQTSPAQLIDKSIAQSRTMGADIQTEQPVEAPERKKDYRGAHEGG